MILVDIVIEFKINYINRQIYITASRHAFSVLKSDLANSASFQNICSDINFNNIRKQYLSHVLCKLVGGGAGDRMLLDPIMSDFTPLIEPEQASMCSCVLNTSS